MDTGVTVANRYMCAQGLRPCCRQEGARVISGRNIWPSDAFGRAIALEAARTAVNEINEGRLVIRPVVSAHERDTYKTFLASEGRRCYPRTPSPRDAIGA